MALVGLGEASRHLAPYDDPTWEIWGVNEGYLGMPRFTRWFAMHPQRDQILMRRDPHHWEWLRACPVPVYTLVANPELPTSVRYPIEAYIERFGAYASGSVAYMIGLAIMEGFREIGLFGFDGVGGGEYFSQRANLEYLIGYARAMGSAILIPSTCLLLTAPTIYGYEMQSLEDIYEQAASLA